MTLHYGVHDTLFPLQWRHNVRDSVSNHHLTIVYSTVYSDADQRKHQSSASLAFVWVIHRGPVNSPHKRPVPRKMFPFDDVTMIPIQSRSKRKKTIRCCTMDGWKLGERELLIWVKMVKEKHIESLIWNWWEWIVITVSITIMNHTCTVPCHR